MRNFITTGKEQWGASRSVIAQRIGRMVDISAIVCLNAKELCSIVSDPLLSSHRAEAVKWMKDVRPILF
jgi:hypothetical protein